MKRSLILLCSLYLLIACEDIPCRRDMSNPYLNIRFKSIREFYYDTIDIKVKFKKIIVNNLTFNLDTSILVTPIFPDQKSLNIHILYDTIFSLYFHIDSVNTYFLFNNDTLVDTLTTTENLRNIHDINPSQIDSIEIDSLLYSKTDLKQKTDTNKIINIEHNINVFYTSGLTSVSQECGFTYEYHIDSINYEGCFIDTILIKNRDIKAPNNLYEEIPRHIEIYFPNTAGLNCK